MHSATPLVSHPLPLSLYKESIVKKIKYLPITLSHLYNTFHIVLLPTPSHSSPLVFSLFLFFLSKSLFAWTTSLSIVSVIISLSLSLSLNSPQKKLLPPHRHPSKVDPFLYLPTSTTTTTLQHCRLNQISVILFLCKRVLDSLSFKGM
ncbi:Hypothetical predicted protein [Octopus vulgaris]|uniref:Transmembrane protein n=1 Tax=Octopus vulgaris TaxID=6645 RepID=A0AA36FEI5_OCTVU|nr:Hypothetical predicted protein [Octopus vulgaris]